MVSNRDASKVICGSVSLHFFSIAWSKASKFQDDAPQRAEELLNLQLSLADSDALGETVAPDFQTYSTTSMTHARSRANDSVKHTRRLLEECMEYARSRDKTKGSPSGPFDAIFVAASHTGKSNDKKCSDGFTDVVDTVDSPFAIAEQTYEDLRDDTFGVGAKPDHRSFAAFLKCINIHTEPQTTERENKARMVFEDACMAGHLSWQVMRGLHTALGKKAYSIPEIQANILPPSWTEHVPHEFQYREKRPSR